MLAHGTIGTAVNTARPVVSVCGAVSRYAVPRQYVRGIVRYDRQFIGRTITDWTTLVHDVPTVDRVRRADSPISLGKVRHVSRRADADGAIGTDNTGRSRLQYLARRIARLDVVTLANNQRQYSAAVDMRHKLTVELSRLTGLDLSRRGLASAETRRYLRQLLTAAGETVQPIDAAAMGLQGEEAVLWSALCGAAASDTGLNGDEYRSTAEAYRDNGRVSLYVLADGIRQFSAHGRIRYTAQLLCAVMESIGGAIVVRRSLKVSRRPMRRGFHAAAKPAVRRTMAGDVAPVLDGVAKHTGAVRRFFSDLIARPDRDLAAYVTPSWGMDDSGHITYGIPRTKSAIGLVVRSGLGIVGAISLA
jgi:hypothetical protein